MGAIGGDIKCTGCDYSGEYVPLTGYYSLSGVTHHMSYRAGWCNAEKRLTTIETLPSVASLTEVVEDLEGNGKDKLDEVTGLISTVERRLFVARAIVAWRKRRKTPEHCLSCGSPDFVECDLIGDDNPHPHPGCPNGGQLQQMTMIVSEQSPTGFDAEGLLLRFAVKDVVRLTYERPEVNVGAVGTIVAIHSRSFGGTMIDVEFAETNAGSAKVIQLVEHEIELVR